MPVAAWNVKDVFDVLFVPVFLAVLALLWPSWQALRRRWRFYQLVYEELLESMPSGTGDAWHGRLAKEFVHRRIIVGAVEASEFVLSLDARFTYELNQMWSSYQRAGQAGRTKDTGWEDTVADGGVSWCWSLYAVCNTLQRHQRWRFRRRAMRRWRLNVLCRAWVAAVCQQHQAARGELAELASKLRNEREGIPSWAIPSDKKNRVLVAEQSLDERDPCSSPNAPQLSEA
jgi:hypothetical protein